MADTQVALVLQGGGALGAYQGGVFQGLTEHEIQIDWVVGTSIGAINGAIIAGNPPEQRLQKLEKFWQLVGRDPHALFSHPAYMLWLKPWTDAHRVMDVLVNGVPGFFRPRASIPWDLNQKALANATGFYDTSPLKETLEQVVDFDYLNAGHVRCTVCAVNVASGELTTFDNMEQVIDPLHIMASGALPPGFPPVEIDGETYWDGGIYSNTPIDIVLDDAERRDTLCFMVDLWDPTENIPTTIGEAITRQKDIQYASRSREHLDDHRKMQNLRRAIRILLEHVPAKDRKLPHLKHLIDLSCDSSINIVRLIMKALPNDDHTKDIDFTRTTVNARWKAGHHDIERALQHKSWLAPLPPYLGMAVHELKQK